MKIILNYTELMERLDYITNLVEDSSIDEKMRNIIFEVKQDSVHLIGYNNLCAISKVVITDSSVTGLEKDVEYLQIHVTDFSKLLKSLSTSRRTKVARISLETRDGFLVFEANEEAISDDIDYAQTFNQKISWKFNMLQVSDRTLKSITVSGSEVNTESVLCKDIKVYLDTLMPVISGEPAGDNSSKIYFGEEFVYVNPRVSLILIANTLREAFKNMSLTSKASRFLSKLLTGNDVIEVGRTSMYIVIKFEGVEAYINYVPVIMPIDSHMSKIAKLDDTGNPVSYKGDYTNEQIAERIAFVNKKNGVIIEKIYFQDVLKRVQWLDESIILKFNIQDSLIEIRSKKFKQNIPILKVKGMSDFGEVRFSIPPSILTNLLVGDDDLFSSTVFMFIIQCGKSLVLVNTDNTGSWLSIVQTQYQ